MTQAEFECIPRGVRVAVTNSTTRPRRNGQSDAITRFVRSEYGDRFCGATRTVLLAQLVFDGESAPSGELFRAESLEETGAAARKE